MAVNAEQSPKVVGMAEKILLEGCKKKKKKKKKI